MPRLSLSPLLLLAAGACVAAAQDPAPSSRADKERMTDDVFSEWASTASPGCAVGIVEDGELTFTRGYGSANLDYEMPLDRSSVFYIASTSKQFAAAALAELVADGRVGLEDPVQRFVPEVPEYEWPVRVRHLIHHTSGLRDYLGLMALAGSSYEDYWDNASGLALLERQRGLNFEPGSEFLYSNSGYILMAEIVERVTGQTLQEFSRERFFEPLGMDRTHWGEDRTAVVPNRVVSYDRNDDGTYRGWLKNFHGKGDGNLLTSVEDLARWDGIFYSDDPRWSSLAETMLTPGVLNDGTVQDYAWGLFHGEYRDVATVSHGGGMLGFRTEFMRFPSERFSAIALCNMGSIVPGRLTRALADIWLFDTPPDWLDEEADDQGPEEETDGVDAPADLSRFVGSYHSPELDTTYELGLSEGSLQVEWPGGVEVLEPTGPAAFRFSGVELAFPPGPGSATGFTLTAGRVRGIEFDRR